MVDIAETLGARGKHHGDFVDHANISQDLQELIRNAETTTGPAWPKLSAIHRHSLSSIADKIARILAGDPDYSDHWHDIQGYAKLAEDHCVDRSSPQLPLQVPPFPFSLPLPEQPEGEGWFIWSGHQPPLSVSDRYLQTQFRNGVINIFTEVSDLRWGWFGKETDIVRARYVDIPVQPSPHDWPLPEQPEGEGWEEWPHDHAPIPQPGCDIEIQWRSVRPTDIIRKSDTLRGGTKYRWGWIGSGGDIVRIRHVAKPATDIKLPKKPVGAGWMANTEETEPTMMKDECLEIQFRNGDLTTFYPGSDPLDWEIRHNFCDIVRYRVMRNDD